MIVYVYIIMCLSMRIGIKGIVSADLYVCYMHDAYTCDIKSLCCCCFSGNILAAVDHNNKGLFLVSNNQGYC